jgi:hypothetical protein
MDFLVSSVINIEASFDHIAPSSVQATQEEYEGFIGCKIPEQIKIYPPIDICSKGKDQKNKESQRMVEVM